MVSIAPVLRLRNWHFAASRRFGGISDTEIDDRSGDGALLQ
jgi:hypothetical protein